MILLFIQTYFSLLLSIGGTALVLFVSGLYFILKKNSPINISVVAKYETPIMLKHPPTDLSAIAGEDMLGTQLDLARAYIETNNKTLARKLLTPIMTQGSAEQQREAQRLLTQTHD
jgi:FimV-like protein